MTNYKADECSIGDGWKNAEDTAGLWNTHIQPILQAHTDYDAVEPEPPVVSASPGRAQEAHEWAWERFCELGAGDDERICIDLAEELEAKLND